MYCGEHRGIGREPFNIAVMTLLAEAGTLHDIDRHPRLIGIDGAAIFGDVLHPGSIDLSGIDRGHSDPGVPSKAARTSPMTLRSAAFSRRSSDVMIQRAVRVISGKAGIHLLVGQLLQLSSLATHLIGSPSFANLTRLGRSCRTMVKTRVRGCPRVSPDGEPRLKRAKHHGKPTKTRPLSPHLTVWRWGPHMLVSILHRITGSRSRPSPASRLLTWWLMAIADGPDAYAQVA